MAEPRPHPPSGSPIDATRAALGEAIRAEQKAEQAVAALGDLRQRVAAMARAETAGPALIEALARKAGATRAALWRLGASSFEIAGSVGGAAPKLRFPAPHPFGQAVNPPRGWLPAEGLPPQLLQFGSPTERLYFVPLERELLLLGFAILALPARATPDAAVFEDLDPLLALGARLLHHQWEMEDLSARRSALAEEVSEQRRYAQALEETRWGVTQGDRVRTEFLRFASRSLHQGLGELLVLLKLGTEGAYTEEEAGAAFQSVLRGAKESFERHGGAGLIWPNLWTPLPQVLGDAVILQEVFATLLGLQAFHALAPHEALRIEMGATALRLRFPFPSLDLGPVVGALDGLQSEGPDPGGTGGPALALIVSRQLLRDLGGELRVEPEGQGSLVCVDLALAQA